MPHIFIIKNQHVESRFCITDMDSLVSISLYLSLKEYRDWKFFISWGTNDQILGAIDEIDSVPHITVFYHIIHVYTSDSMGLTI